VPRPLFFDIPQHVATLRAMLRDMNAGEGNLLLIGNQGVGKNKLADRMLQLLNREREYIQLHRDTTVQSLTLVPSLVDGRIVYEDSPLVAAARFGRTLLVDEADKAPLEVVGVLKALVEDGEMLLGDGRRLMTPQRLAMEPWHDPANTIAVHPEFRVWVLANRPGFPFLGNDFFRESGDIYATHTIDNPDPVSEQALLSSYSPGTPPQILQRLVASFAELRAMTAEGLLTYPYSTREAVAVAKHLQLYPHDGVVRALENVLAFDAYDAQLRRSLAEVFRSHGIPVSPTASDASAAPVARVAKPLELPAPALAAEWGWGGDGASAGVSGAARLQAVAVEPLDVRRLRAFAEPPAVEAWAAAESRLGTFTEEVQKWTVPCDGRWQQAVGMVGLRDDSVHALVTAPLTLHSFSGVSAAANAAALADGGGAAVDPAAAAAAAAAAGGPAQDKRHEVLELQGGWGSRLDGPDDPRTPRLVALAGREGEGDAGAPERDLLAVYLPETEDGAVLVIDRGAAAAGKGEPAMWALAMPAEPPAVATAAAGGGGGGEEEGGSARAMKRLRQVSRFIGGGSGDGGGGDGEGGAAAASGAVELSDAMSSEGLLLRFRRGGDHISILDARSGEGARLALPLAEGAGLQSVAPASRGCWLVHDTEGAAHWLRLRGAEQRLAAPPSTRYSPLPTEASLQQVSVSATGEGGAGQPLFARAAAAVTGATPPLAHPPAHLSVDTTARALARPGALLEVGGMRTAL
jgi:hypothetical protein